MKQEKLFGDIGLNTDDDARYFSDNDSDLIQNMVPDIEGAGGNERTYEGTVEIPTEFGLVNPRVIGSCRDPKTNLIYYFVKEQIAISSETTTTEGFIDVNYGYLYNWYAATDAKNVAASGWHVPTRAEFYTLMRFIDNDGLPGNNTAGTELKDTSYWDLPNTNTNSLGFNGRGAGMRAFGFSSLLRITYYQTTTERTSVPSSVHAAVLYSSFFGSPWVNLLNIGDNDDYANDVSNKVLGKSIRLLKDSTLLAHGQTGTYLGNDGKVYNTICIGTQEWLSDNLCETLYRDGTPIPEVTDNATWAALVTGARCSYDNDEDNALISTGAVTTTTEWDVNNHGNSILEFDPVLETYRKIVFQEPYLYMGDWVYGAKVFKDWIIYNSGTHGVRKVHIAYANRYYSIDRWHAGPYIEGDLVHITDGRCYSANSSFNSVISPENDTANWTFEYYTYPYPIISNTFALRNLPPMDRPTCVYGTDGKFRNNLQDKTFQFAYRYKYIDGGYSVYSEPSDICLPPNIEKWNGDFVFSLYDNNYLQVSFTRGELSMVEYVEVVVREGNDGDWRFYASVIEDVNSINFSNDEKYESIDQDSVNKIEDSCPLQVADVTLINENRIAVARPTEGFDNIAVDVNMWPVTEDISIVTPESGTLTLEDVVDEGIDMESYCTINTSHLTNPANYNTNDILRITLNIHGTTYTSDYTLLAPDTASLADMVGRIVTEINTLISGMGTAVMILAPGQPSSIWNVTNTDDYDIEIEMDSLAYRLIAGTVQVLSATVANSTNRWNTYKSGAIHPHAIQYWDEEFRRSTIQRSAACDVEVRERSYYADPQNPATTTTRWVDSMNYRIKINWEINHLAPSWARYWSWVYAGNKTQESFVQYIISGVDTTVTDYPNYLGLTIAPLQDLKTDAVTYPFPKSIIDPYSYVAGDRVRILTGTPEGGFLGDAYQGADYYDLPIAGLVDNILLVPSPDGDDFGAAVGSLIEIYTPRTFEEDAELYFLVGDINEVVDGYHMNPDGVDQTALVPASGTLESGDAYVIARAFSELIAGGAAGDLFAVESMHWSDFYLSDAYDRGKPNIYSDIGETTNNNIRWGNKHQTGVSVNNLFTFDAFDYKPTTEIYGDIERIGETGDVLKVIFNRKVASMYIGKTEYTDVNGSSAVVTSEQVLSNPNYSIDDYGTTIPQAVLFNAGYCYFIDLYNGAIIRNTNNGSFPISGGPISNAEGSYKMHAYFRDLCADALLAIANGNDVRFLLGWDGSRDWLYVSILNSSIETRTIIFREGRNRWIAWVDLWDAVGNFPTCYEWAGDKFFSFLDGSDSVWSHHDPSATDLLVYNDAKTAIIDIWGTLNPNQIKVYDSFALHTNARGWSGQVFISESLSYPDGMESRLPAHLFSKRENVLYTEYLFNALTRNGTFSASSLYNGETLRGYTINNKMSITTAAKLFKADINMRLSAI